MIQACLDDGRLPTKQRGAFKSISQLIVSTLHFEDHQIIEELKNSFAPFDPNCDTLPVTQLTVVMLLLKQDVFTDRFT